MLRKEEGGDENKITYQPDAYLLKKRIAKGGSIGPDGQYVPARKGRPPKEGGPRRLNKGKNAKGATAKAKATTRKGTKSKSANDDHDSDEEEPEAEESGHDDEDDDGDNDGGQSSSTRGVRDEDEFVGRTKDPGPLNGEKRATRLSTGKLAPIFARQSSKSTAASGEEDEEEEEGQEEEENVEEGERREAEAGGLSSSSKKSTKKPARAAVAATQSTKDPTKSPGKPRGRPRKNPPAVDPVASNQTLLSMMRISQSEPLATDKTTSTIAGKDTSSVDVEMTEVVVEETIVASVATEATTSTTAIPATATAATAGPKTSAASTVAPKKPRGRPPKAKPAMTETTTATAPGGSDNERVSMVTSNEAASAQGANIGAAADAIENRETTDMHQEDDPRRQSSESAVSSRASSVVPEAATVGAVNAPGTPGKKETAAPRLTRKRKEVEKSKSTNRTLTDLWGGKK